MQEVKLPSMRVACRTIALAMASGSSGHAVAAKDGITSVYISWRGALHLDRSNSEIVNLREFAAAIGLPADAKVSFSPKTLGSLTIELWSKDMDLSRVMDSLRMRIILPARADVGPLVEKIRGLPGVHTEEVRDFYANREGDYKAVHMKSVWKGHRLEVQLTDERSSVVSGWMRMFMNKELRPFWKSFAPYRLEVAKAVDRWEGQGGLDLTAADAEFARSSKPGQEFLRFTKAYFHSKKPKYDSDAQFAQRAEIFGMQFRNIFAIMSAWRRGETVGESEIGKAKEELRSKVESLRSDEAAFLQELQSGDVQNAGTLAHVRDLKKEVEFIGTFMEESDSLRRARVAIVAEGNLVGEVKVVARELMVAGFRGKIVFLRGAMIGPKGELTPSATTPSRGLPQSWEEIPAASVLRSPDVDDFLASNLKIPLKETIFVSDADAVRLRGFADFGQAPERVPNWFIANDAGKALPSKMHNEAQVYLSSMFGDNLAKQVEGKCR